MNAFDFMAAHPWLTLAILCIVGGTIVGICEAVADAFRAARPWDGKP